MPDNPLHWSQLDRIENALAGVQQTLNAVLKKEGKIIMTLTELQTQVAANTNLEQSAIVLINGIAAQLAAAATDPAKVQALADQLKASATALAAAITTNTPAVVTPAP